MEHTSGKGGGDVYKGRPVPLFCIGNLSANQRDKEENRNGSTTHAFSLSELVFGLTMHILREWTGNSGNKVHNAYQYVSELWNW